VRSRLRFSAAIVAVASLCAVGLIEASRVRPINLEEMTERADRIFAGRCVAVRAARDPELGQWVTYATFVVQRAVKGDVRGAVTIKMLGDPDPAAPRGGRVRGLPMFREGEEVVLFLYGDSRRGLTSPVGFGQGKFVVSKDKRGGRLAVNAFGNDNLFRKLTPRAQDRLRAGRARSVGQRGIPPDALLEMVESLRR
jgi:hypothetical protein